MRLDKIKALLPAVFQQAVVEGTPLYSLLAVMEQLHAQTEHTLAIIDCNFDPRRAPERFIPMLAQWVDLGWLIGQAAPSAEPGDEKSPDRSAVLSTDRLRDLVIVAVDLSRRRGTVDGLSRFLKLALGSDGFKFHENVNSAGQTTPFHLWIEADPALKSQCPLIERIVATEKPAYLTHELTLSLTPAAQ